MPPPLPHTHTHRETWRRLVARPANYQHLAPCVCESDDKSWKLGEELTVFVCESVRVYSASDIQ
jgi:hypothetical protein